MGLEVIQGDCLEVMRSIPDGSIDACITDPPYKDYETNRYDASGWHRPILAVSPRLYAPLLYRVLRPKSASLIWLTWVEFEQHKAAFESAGFEVRNCIVWGKPNHTAGDLDGNLGNQYEVAMFAVKGAWTRHDKRETNLWLEPHLFSRAYRHHPTEKPVGLMQRSVRLACEGGGVVLDPFAGSGPTGVACAIEGRRFMGIEQDAHYVEVARARIARASGQAVDIPRAVRTEKELPLFQEVA